MDNWERLHASRRLRFPVTKLVVFQQKRSAGLGCWSAQNCHTGSQAPSNYDEVPANRAKESVCPSVAVCLGSIRFLAAAPLDRREPRGWADGYQQRVWASNYPLAPPYERFL